MNILKWCILAVSAVFIFAFPVQAEQTGYDMFGSIGVGYSDGDSDHIIEDVGYGYPDTSALANFGDPALISGFSFSKAYGLNAIGAKTGILVNSFGAGPFSPTAPPKYNAGGHGHAYALATNRYYYSGSGTNMLTDIRMDFVWDGLVSALMSGVSASDIFVAMDGDGGEGGLATLSYRLWANAGSEGIWDPSGFGWYWSFSEEETFVLEDVDGDLIWSDGQQSYSDLNKNISGTENMIVPIVDHGLLQGSNPSFLVNYGIEVEIALMGLDFEEGGYMNMRSDFYDTLGITNTSENISLEPFNAVPIPAAVWLLGSGIAVLLGFKRRFKA